MQIRELQSTSVVRRRLMHQYAVEAPFWYATNVMLVLLGVYWLLDPIFLRLGMSMVQPRAERIFVAAFTAVIITVVVKNQRTKPTGHDTNVKESIGP